MGMEERRHIWEVFKISQLIKCVDEGKGEVMVDEHETGGFGFWVGGGKISWSRNMKGH